VSGDALGDSVILLDLRSCVRIGYSGVLLVLVGVGCMCFVHPALCALLFSSHSFSNRKCNL